MGRGGSELAGPGRGYLRPSSLDLSSVLTNMPWTRPPPPPPLLCPTALEPAAVH